MIAVKTEPAEEPNPESETAAQETEATAVVKEEEKEEGEKETPEDTEVEEKDKSLTDPNLEEQKPVMAAPPPVADIKFNITTKVCKIQPYLILQRSRASQCMVLLSLAQLW